MKSMMRFITAKLKLKVNNEKSAVARPVGTEVSGLQLHERRHNKTADRAESGGPVQGADAGTDVPDARGEHRANNARTGCVYTWLDRLLRQNAKRLPCCKVSRSGPDAGCGLWFGSSGNEDRRGLPH